MFDYPLPPLRTGVYAQLGLGPDATSEEIDEARQELSNQLRRQLKAGQADLEAIYQKVPGLREACAELEAAEAAGTTSDKATAAQAKLAILEDAALRAFPGYKRLREDVAQLERRLHEANLLPIRNPKDRLEYDRCHPPLELLKLADCATSPLDDRKQMLAIVRKELSDFLEQCGEEVFHPSDFTRRDFSHDFTEDKTLDRPS